MELAEHSVSFYQGMGKKIEETCFDSRLAVRDFFFSRTSRRSLVSTQPTSQRVSVFLPSLGEKRKKCEDDPSPPSDSEVKNAWSCTLKCTNFTRIIYKQIYKFVLKLNFLITLLNFRCRWRGLLVNAQKSNDNFYD